MFGFKTQNTLNGNQISDVWQCRNEKLAKSRRATGGMGNLTVKSATLAGTRRQLDGELDDAGWNSTMDQDMVVLG
ncbi:hypothetical protein Q3G72_013496 [Acer saccharum]|nr:hypothetical protein Q3G72_013496 [Acer saccharum]